jgi:uncharacterized protein (UPF0333 family)
MSKIQMIFGLLLFLIILFSMNMIFYESFTTNIKMSLPLPSHSPSSSSAPSNKPKNNNKVYSRLSTQNQNDDQPLFFGFS